MNAIERRGSLLPFALLVTAVYAAEVLTVRLALPRASRPGLLAAGVAFDLVAVVPAAYWAPRLRGRRPASRVMPVFLLSLVGAAAVLPATYRGLVPMVRLLAVPAELAIFALIVLRARRAFREAPAAGADAAERFRDAAIAARCPTAPRPR
jgi:O-antigen/teichoic acid export membrane protein